MAREIFQIEDGKLYLAVVDTDAVGYDTSWLAPGGDNVTEVTAADYSTGVDLSCQVSSAALTASSTVNTVTVPATFCAPEENVPQPATTAYILDATILQDPHISDGRVPVPVRARHRVGVLHAGAPGRWPTPGDRRVPGDRRQLRRGRPGQPDLRPCRCPSPAGRRSCSVTPRRRCRSPQWRDG